MFSKDINEDGKNDIVLGYNQSGKNYPLRGKSCSSQQIPELKELLAIEWGEDFDPDEFDINEINVCFHGGWKKDA